MKRNGMYLYILIYSNNNVGLVNMKLAWAILNTLRMVTAFIVVIMVTLQQEIY